MPASRGPNIIPIWGNEKSMNLNPMILTNIQNSPYYKVQLITKQTYHEVIDEIYYKVDHLEPWERGSRKTAGQTGMCGGVRGVGAGGIVSTAWCILYKLYTLRLTRNQVVGLMNHNDSPYIRALGFLYIRLTQPPPDLFDWFEDYLEDEEEIDVKAGGGCVMTIGEMLAQWLCKLEWYSTMFPRIPVPVAKNIQERLACLRRSALAIANNTTEEPVAHAPVHQGPNTDDAQQARSYNKPIPDDEVNWGEAEKAAAELRRHQRPDKGGNNRDVPLEARRSSDTRGERRDHRARDHRDHPADTQRHNSRRSRSVDREGESRHHRSKELRAPHSKHSSHHSSRDRSRERRRHRSESRGRHKKQRSRSRSRSRHRHKKQKKHHSHKHHKKHHKHHGRDRSPDHSSSGSDDDSPRRTKRVENGDRET